MRGFFLKLRRRRTLERDLEAELALHRELSNAQGHTAPFGSTTRILEESRDLWRFAAVEDFWRDVRYAARALLRQPAFAIFALLALTLGIGLNLAVFTMFVSMGARPLPGVREPEHLIRFDNRTSYGPAFFSAAEHRQLRTDMRTVSGIEAAATSSVVINERDVSVDLVTAGFFELLGVRLAHGRAFTTAEHDSGTSEVALVLSHTLWRSEFASDRGIIGRQITLGRIPARVVGVADPAFTEAELWAPMAAFPLLDPDRADDMAADEPCCQLIARLAANVTRRQAQSEMDVLAGRLQSMRSARHAPALDPVALRDVGRAEATFRGLFPIFLVVQLTAGAILLLACANVGNLVLTRGLTRHRELAVRLSLGAGRMRIVRQLVVESLLLTGVASAIAVVAIYAVTPVFGQTPLWRDAAVVGYGLLVALLATLVCGLAPALRATRVSPGDSLKQDTMHATQRVSLRGVLLGTQISLSLALLVCAALLVRGLWHVSTVDLGFRSEGVSALSLQLPWKAYLDPRRERAFRDQVRRDLAQFGPIGIGDAAPPMGLNAQRQVTLPPGASRPGETVSVSQMAADAGYFEILHIPVIAGRTLLPADQDHRHIVINETLARRYWRTRSPIGETLAYRTSLKRDDGALLLDHTVTATIVGVVRDAQITGPGRIEPTFFEPPAGVSMTVLVSDAAASTAIAAIRRIEPRVKVSLSRPSENLDASRREATLIASYASGLGALALVLATIGVYGVFSYSVEQRRREISIRLALGGTSSGIVGLIVRRDLRAVLGGLAGGLALSFAASTFLVSRLYGVGRLDPLAYLAVLLLLFVAGISASALPARRVTATDPAKTLYVE